MTTATAATPKAPPRARVVDGYFAFSLKAVPATPTHCRCGVELEPLRRYAGLCKRCVVRWMRRQAKRVRPTTMRIVRRFKRTGVPWVEVRCACGEARRMMREATYNAQLPQCCNKCRLRDVEQRGFEAEYSRPKRGEPRRFMRAP